LCSAGVALVLLGELGCGRLSVDDVEGRLLHGTCPPCR
jgi:hypothetical protein